MTLEEVEETMTRLAVARPAFHSEADFQHALAWQLHSEYPSARIRLETRPRRRVHLDIMALVDGRRIAIELKYFSRSLTTTVEDEVFELSSQAAQDLGRYDFVKDVARLELLLADGLADEGFAIALTNDPGYWQEGRANTVDAAFRLGEGRSLVGVLEWAAHTGVGTKRNRELPITLGREYRLAWRDFSQVEGSRYGRFRYLLVHVEPR